MRELPGAGGGQHSHLNQGPAHDAGVGGFGLVTELGLTFLQQLSVSIGPERFTYGP